MNVSGSFMIRTDGHIADGSIHYLVKSAFKSRTASVSPPFEL